MGLGQNFILTPTSHYTPTMSSSNISGNNSNNASGINWKQVASPNLLEQMNNSIEVQIVKVDKQSWQRCNKIMKRVAEQEVQRKAEEEKCKAKEKAKQKAEEEKWKAEENKHRAEEEYRVQGEVKRKQKADVQEATEAFRVKIAQGGVQGTKPKVCNHSLSYFFFANFPFCFYSLLGQ